MTTECLDAMIEFLDLAPIEVVDRVEWYHLEYEGRLLEKITKEVMDAATASRNFGGSRQPAVRGCHIRREET